MLKLIYVSINTMIVLALTSFFLGFGGEKGVSYSKYVILLLVTITILFFEHHFLMKHSKWYSHILIRYIGMATYMIVLGLIMNWNTTVGSSPAGSLLARLDGMFRFFIFGHGLAILLFIGVMAFHFLFQYFISLRTNM